MKPRFNFFFVLGIFFLGAMLGQWIGVAHERAHAEKGYRLKEGEWAVRGFTSKCLQMSLDYGMSAGAQKRNGFDTTKADLSALAEACKDVQALGMAQ